MQLTKGCEYAIRGLAYLANEGGDEPVLLSRIAEVTDVPRNYLANLFQQLARLGLVHSHRGAKRGYSLARPAKETTLREIVEAVDGPVVISTCGSNGAACTDEHACALTHVWDTVRRDVLKRLEKVTLRDLRKSCFLS